MKIIINRVFLLLMGSTLMLSACKDSSSSPNEEPIPVETITIDDIAANVNTTITPRSDIADLEGDTEETGNYTYYDLDSNSEVEDSESSEWDIAFGGTTILANSENNGGIQVVDTKFDELKEAPTDGYTLDASGWFTYTGSAASGPQHAVIADTLKSLVIRTSDGRYAKVKIMSYYKGNPDINSAEFINFATRPETRFFTFTYLIQTNTTTELYHEDYVAYLDFETSDLVQDGASSQWDIGLAGISITANSDNQGGVQVLSIPFDELMEAPIEGYTSEASGWYTYTGSAASGPQHAVLPNSGETLVFKTGDGKYAKVRILSYYKGNPDVSDPVFIDTDTRPDPRYYTLEYAIQNDGSRSFE